jgi:hypothetical protein
MSSAGSYRRALRFVREEFSGADFARMSQPQSAGRFGIPGMLVLMADSGPIPDEQAPAPNYSEEGVDLSLIAWMLSLTPVERLEFLNDRIIAISMIRALNARE